jgi:hypothetical protein
LVRKEFDIKDILSQYCDLKQEVKDKQTAIDKLDKQIAEMKKHKDKVIDSVKGGEGGIQHFKIEGFPYPELEEKERMLFTRRIRLEQMKVRLDRQLAQAEEYINKIPDSRLRRIITYRYIECLSWVQVAHKMGKNHTEDSCKKTIERFFKNN